MTFLELTKKSGLYLGTRMRGTTHLLNLSEENVVSENRKESVRGCDRSGTESITGQCLVGARHPRSAVSP